MDSHAASTSTTMAANIPKFASFRPKPKPPVPAPRAHDAPVAPSDKARKTSPSPPQAAVAAATAESRPYFSDRRGDTDVLRYGMLNCRDIPAYRRFGHGCVLGLDPDHTIDREQSTSAGLYLAFTARRRQPRLLTDKRINKAAHRALRLVRAKDNVEHFDQDFISLSVNGERRRAASEENEEADRELTYRSIEGLPNAEQPRDPDTHYEPDVGMAIDTEVTRKNGLFARRTKEEPGKVQHWLDLIQHQEAMLKLERPSDELTASDKAHLAQVRISIYEEALKKLGEHLPGQIQLWIGLLTEGKRVWDDTRSASKWNEALAKHPHSLDLWWLYLDFVQSTFTRFKYEDCRSAFLASVAAFSSSTGDCAPETQLHILLRLTSMIRDAGYQELALAAWQAVFELHLMRPAPSEGASLRGMFETFWDSEVPRIGEPGAKGWQCAAAGDGLPPCPPALLESNPSLDPLDDFQRREWDAMTKLPYPGRTSDDVGEDDAFHTVFFSDIEPFLDIVPAETSVVLIFEAFLCFCGLPPLPRLAVHQQRWWADPFLHHEQSPVAPTNSEPNPSFEGVAKFSGCSSASFQMTTDLLFRQSFAMSGHKLEPDFVRRMLKFIAMYLSSEDIIGEYLLAFEHQRFPSDAFKTAKQLLKISPTSLRLYNAYALVELSRDNIPKATQVLSMALSMQKGETRLLTQESLQLYYTWVWEACHRGDKTEALWRFVSPDGQVPARNTPVESPNHELLQRATLRLSARSERALLHSEYHIAVLSTSLHALLLYLMHNAEPEPALHIHQSLSIWMKSNKLSGSVYADLHAQSIAQFLLYHATHAATFKPVLIRTTLEPLIVQFPNNTLILSIYAANEARFAIDDRVRDMMHKRVFSAAHEPSVTGWEFAIRYETLRRSAAGSTTHSIRALYKRAVDSTGMHCQVLWTSYVRFELAQLRDEEAKAGLKMMRSEANNMKDYRASRIKDAKQRVKDTFYAGLQCLPWCKDFALLAFMPEFGGVFSEVERGRVYRVMLEKEMRLYIELDEGEEEVRAIT